MIIKDKLSNDIKFVVKTNPNTPRIAMAMFLKTAHGLIEKPGVNTIFARLLMQGTKTRSAVELASDMDENAIDIGIDVKQDYIKLKAVCLNEDFEYAAGFISDILKNSTLEEFEKEKVKLIGEITADLDSPKSKAVDNLIKNMYQNHPYGNSCSVLLETLENLNLEDVRTFYDEILISGNLNIALVGDVENIAYKAVLEQEFGDVKNLSKEINNSNVKDLTKEIKVTIEKEDASQAQVIQGWVLPGILSDDYPAISVLNTILGSSGLSSRLFVELRDKKGLAYTVRSSYEALEKCGTFTTYIATEPKNIKVSLEGFRGEIKKLQDESVCEDELKSAKNNIIGKRAFFHETNAQQAHYLGSYESLGLGVEFDKEIEAKIKAVTANEVQEAARKYLNENSVISLLAPKKFL